MKNLIFVDDEVRILQALQRQFHAMRNEWSMKYFERGQAALDYMAGQQTDVIVTDMMMPGMDGAQLLTEVSRLHPQTVRIVLSGHMEHEATLRLVGPAHQYLCKPCATDTLRKAIVRAFGLRELLASEQLKRLAAQIKTLPTLPATQSKLLQELQSETPSLDRVSEIIARDVGMTAKILQLTNSAFFGLPRPTSNLTEAMVYLGLATVRALAFSVEMFSRFSPLHCRLFSLDSLEHHSWQTALLARQIAHLEQQPNDMMDQCFLAGLMHDVGQLVLADSLPNEYALVIDQARQNKQPIYRQERELFGASHADVGAYLLGLWGLPNPIIEAVAFHHNPAQSAQPQFSPVLAVHVADFLIHEQQQVGTEMPPPILDLSYLEKIGLASRLEAWRAASCETIKQQ
jgi:HD-like signal output (HDOD) protein